MYFFTRYFINFFESKICYSIEKIYIMQKSPEMRIRIWSDPLIFGLPDPVLFSLDPDPNPTCYNGFIKLFSSSIKYTPELTKSSSKWWFIISTFMPTYLKYNTFFFLLFDLRSDPNFFPQLSRIRIHEKKCRNLILAKYYCGGGGTWTLVRAWPRPFYALGTVGSHLAMVNLPYP